MPWTPVVIYLAIVFSLTFALDAWIYSVGGLSNVQAFQTGATIQMLIPGLVAIFMRAVRREGFKGTGLGLGRKKYYGIAFVLILGWLAASVLLSALTPWLTLDTGLTRVHALFSTLAQQTGQAQPLSDAQLLPILGLQMVLIGPILGLPALFGEEYGWRGYLLPKLLPLGHFNAIFGHGVIWGLWHAPLIIMGYNYPGQPVFGVLFMTIFTVLLGAVLAWLYYASGSIWVSSFAHGVVNQGAAFALMLIAGHHVLVGGPLGLIGLALLLVIVVVLYRTGRFDAVGTLSHPPNGAGVVGD